MKRLLLYVLILAAVLAVPVKRVDVAKLQPVQTVAVYRHGRYYVIETDTGDMGQGTDPVAAYENLEKTTSGVIYLDTADYLLVTEGTTSAVEALRIYLKDTVELYRFLGSPDLKEVSKFLPVHGKGPKLKTWNEGVKLPVLDGRDQRLILR